MAIHSSILAWKIPWMGQQRVQRDYTTNIFIFTFSLYYSLAPRIGTWVIFGVIIQTLPQKGYHCLFVFKVQNFDINYETLVNKL